MEHRTLFRLLPALTTAIVILNCVEGTNPSPYVDPLSLNTTGLFPFQNNGNWWKYTGTYGNSLSISVLDTITDDSTTYFKVAFAETTVDTTDNWFRRSAKGTEYSRSLPGPYVVFLPRAFNSKQGSFTSLANQNISYSYADSLLVNGKVRQRVMQLNFPDSTILGFNEIDLADSLGIIRLIDSRGSRLKVTYSLDSARINGVIHR